MASFHDLQIEWSMLCQDCTECWTESDLQLAAELGKTLLERNKELENHLKQQQNVIEDQAQEIEYLTKQTAALREVNDSRLRIYEQLEVSIQDLERANHRLAIENATDKKQIKSLTSTIESLEIKLEEAQGIAEDFRLQLEATKRKTVKTSPHTEHDGVSPVALVTTSSLTQVLSSSSVAGSGPPRTISSQSDSLKTAAENTPAAPQDVEQYTEQIAHVLEQLNETRNEYAKEHERVVDLEEQLNCLVQQNQSLERKLVQMHTRDEDVKSVHEEFCSLDEVRQGTMCSKCLRGLESPRTADNMSYADEDPEDDDSSMLEGLTSRSQHRSEFSMDIQDYTKISEGGNLYRDLVEKYEALLEVQRAQAMRNQKVYPSLKDEMQLSGEYHVIKDTDEESGHGDSLQTVKATKKICKTFSHTPTDFSEAETSSSGFSDETSNKATQTEGRVGSFLCAIADGDDCKFSIYDDASPIDSRFRNRPEYRELFREIFSVLKNAAESKDDAEQPPVLDDQTPIKMAPRVPPATPCAENLPDFLENLTDDTQSVISSTMSELSVNANDVTLTDNIENVKPETDDLPTSCETAKPANKDDRILTPLIRQPLEYLSVAVNVRKRSGSRRKKHLAERSESPITPILGSPKITYTNRQGSGRKRRDNAKTVDAPNVWNGNTLHFYSHNSQSPTPSHNGGKNARVAAPLEYKPSPASQDLFKLKRLDLSYAEVLRNADNKKRDRDMKSRQRGKR